VGYLASVLRRISARVHYIPHRPRRWCQPGRRRSFPLRRLAR